ncbi:nucleolar protein 12 [Diplodia corticola]|uniref:Nucleolar protein 12 n=1 Tax=Diplodia corticola TaxID=236234 RepID=A0A1J9RA20_9PEZI|nr:nucleolar protein 12 [Diplodia corticola]OJD29267.1 nucleolar protein 12 [Diplodia corticola]
MAKDRSKKPAAAPAASDASLKLTASKKAIDPTLASLFATSVGPAKPRPKEAYQKAPPKTAPEAEDDDQDDDDDAVDEDDEDLSSIDEELPEDSDEEDDEDEDGDTVMRPAEDASSGEDATIPVHESVAAAQGEKSQRKRKRKGDVDELEDVYMRKLEKEEAKEEAKREAERSTKRQRKEDGEAASSDEEVLSDDGGDEDAASDSDAESDSEIPQHETQASQPKAETELEKASRTVFLGNVSINAISDKSAKKTLIKHMSSFLSDLPEHKPPHKFDSIRFRSTPFSTFIPKKAAYATKEVMDETAHSTNAYVVYTTNQAAREAARRLNGTVVLNRHLRVDEVAHPAKTDHHRCVFVGNLSFVDDESMIQEAEAKRLGKEVRKKKEPGDVEEGLWRTFGKAGTVESVRVIRDPKTRVGKGFAYVQFTDENAVEAALLYNDKRFPPMLPRKLRVVRAKGMKRNKTNSATSTRPVSTKGVYNPKVSAEERSMQGRAAKLLGKAGAAKIKSAGKPGGARDFKKEDKPANGFKTPEQFVFEGHRATEKQGKTGLKLGGKKGKKSGKPASRSSKRGAAWKAQGGKKA